MAITVSEVNDPPSRRRRRGHRRRRASRSRWIPATLLANDVAGPSNEAGQALAVTAVAAGADTHGTVTLADGTITYTPDAGFAGTATFTYTVCDNGTTDAAPDPRCAASTGTVTVDVVAPDQPPVADPQSLTVAEDHPLPGHADRLRPRRRPAHVRHRHAARPTARSAGPRPTLTYTPAADYFGPDSFTFTTNDGASDSAPATVSITVTEVNDPPVVGTDAFTLGGGGTLPPPPPAAGVRRPVRRDLRRPARAHVRPRPLRRPGGRRGDRRQVDHRRLRGAGALRPGARDRRVSIDTGARRSASPATG